MCDDILKIFESVKKDLRQIEDSHSAVEKKLNATIEKYVFALNVLRDRNIRTDLGSIDGQSVSLQPCRRKYCIATFIVIDRPRENWCVHCNDMHCLYHVERCAAKNIHRTGGRRTTDAIPTTPRP